MSSKCFQESWHFSTSKVIGITTNSNPKKRKLASYLFETWRQSYTTSWKSKKLLMSEKKFWNEISSSNEIMSVYPKTAWIFHSKFLSNDFYHLRHYRSPIKESVCQLNWGKSIFNRFKLWNSIIQFLSRSFVPWSCSSRCRRELCRLHVHWVDGRKSPRHLVHSIKMTRTSQFP